MVVCDVRVVVAAALLATAACGRSDPAGGPDSTDAGATDGSQEQNQAPDGPGRIEFGIPQDVPLSAMARAVAVGDCNGDGKLDLVVAHEVAAGFVDVLLGRGGSDFGPAQQVLIGQELPAALEMAALDGDGFVDVAVASRGSGSVTILRGRGDGTFGVGAPIPTGVGAFSVRAGRLDADDHLDLAVTARFVGQVVVLSGDGQGGFKVSQRLTAGAEPNELALADFTGDGLLDIVTANLKGNDVGILPGRSFQPATAFASGVQPMAVATGDFDRDGVMDVAVTHFGGDTVGVHRGVGGGRLGPATAYLVADEPWALAAADFDRDGALDLVVGNSAAGSLSFLRGKGTGDFEQPTTLPIAKPERFALVQIVPADLDADGDLDLVVANLAGRVHILLNQRL